MSKELNERASIIKDWIDKSGPDAVLQSAILAYSAKLHETEEFELYFGIIKCLVRARGEDE